MKLEWLFMLVETGNMQCTRDYTVSSVYACEDPVRKTFIKKELLRATNGNLLRIKKQ